MGLLPGRAHLHAVYYYTWNHIPAKLHLAVGWVYAVASVCTLVIINGILTFMLTPGDTWLAVAGTGHEASKFWNAFFNPTYWPSLLMRTLVCVTLAGIWALISSASRIEAQKSAALKASFLKLDHSAGSCPPSWLMPFPFIWYLHMVPESQRALLSLGISTIGTGTFSQVTRLVLLMVITSATIILVAYYLAYKNPKDFTVAHAWPSCCLALVATGSRRAAREMLRKPYVIGRRMYSNGTRVSEVAGPQPDGYLAHTLWLNQSTSAHFAQGEAMYRGQCGSCHTLTGYRSLNKLLAGRDRDSVFEPPHHAPRVQARHQLSQVHATAHRHARRNHRPRRLPLRPVPLHPIPSHPHPPPPSSKPRNNAAVRDELAHGGKRLQGRSRLTLLSGGYGR